MKIKSWKALLGCAAAALSLVAIGVASTNSPIQPTNRPLGLSLIAKTQLAGSDSQSAALQTLTTTYVNYIKQTLPEGVAFTGEGLYQLDPQRLYFLFAYAPRVYYIYEGACYNNALGATIANASAPTNSILSGNTFTIFPFVHSSIAQVCASGSGIRTSSEPLMAGDWVQLPTVQAGQQLSFFLMANMNGQSVPADVWYNGNSNNVDNFQHMIAFMPDQSQYIIIGYEDMAGGGDQDCNDAMFVVDVGPLNSQVWRNPNTLPK